MTADPLDLVTLEEAKGRLGGSVGRVTDDEDIQADITALSAMFDAEFGAMVQRDIDDEDLPFGHRGWVWLTAYPLVGDPIADEGTVTVRKRSHSEVEMSDLAATTISYRAGRYSNTAAVPAKVKSAFILTLRNWRQADKVAPQVPPGPDYPTPRSAFPTYALPNASAHMLHRMRRIEDLG